MEEFSAALVVFAKSEFLVISKYQIETLKYCLSDYSYHKKRNETINQIDSHCENKMKGKALDIDVYFKFSELLVDLPSTNESKLITNERWIRDNKNRQIELITQER
jgi:hypothetical protein